MPLVDLNQTGWYLDEREVLKGNRVKYTAIAVDPSVSPLPDVTRWVWKTSKPTYPLEFWSEVVAAQVAGVVGVHAPRAFPALYDGEYGALMENFVNRDSGEVLDHGGDLLMAFKPDYERAKGRDHSVQLIIRAMQQWGLSQTCYPVLFVQWLFDGIIGNQDRHQDNWGLLVQPDPENQVRNVLRVAPAFDNGSSLGRELTDDGVTALLLDGVRFEKYITKGKAHVRWEEDGGLLEVSHEELLQRHVVSFPKSRTVATGFFNVDPVGVEDAIRTVCRGSRLGTGAPISLEREDLMVRLCLYRLSRFKRILGLDP